ncbi:MAG: amidohydrolase family protein [Idiomarina sp.]|nr:amidohydrolase family protein [Idiomarina sp.]
MNQSANPFGRYFSRPMKMFLTVPVWLAVAFVAPLYASDYVFINVNVVPMGTEEVLAEHAVVIRDDRIVQVASMADFTAPDDAQVIDGGGHYLLPGLAEMHGHVPPMHSDNFPARYLDDTLFLYLAGGITTVRGMLGHPNQLDLVDDIDAGDRLGPTLYLAGPSFNGNSVESAEQGRRMVREHKAAGWDLLKIHPGLSLEYFTAIAEEAASQNIDFAGHIPQAVPLDKAMAMGIRTIDHMDGYLEFVGATDREISDEALQSLVQLTLQYEVGVVPTQALWATLIGAADREALEAYEEAKYVPESVREGWQRYLDNASQSRYYTGDTAQVHQQNRQRLLQALHAAGAEILMGTDAPQVYSVPGLGLKHELAMMGDAGLTPYEVLYTGTVAVGRYFAEQDTFGQVAEGHRADLILTSLNPLEDLSTLEQPLGVMASGRWLARETLDEKLAEIEAAYQ